MSECISNNIKKCSSELFPFMVIPIWVLDLTLRLQINNTHHEGVENEKKWFSLKGISDFFIPNGPKSLLNMSLIKDFLNTVSDSGLNVTKEI